MYNIHMMNYVHAWPSLPQALAMATKVRTSGSTACARISFQVGRIQMLHTIPSCARTRTQYTCQACSMFTVHTCVDMHSPLHACTHACLMNIHVTQRTTVTTSTDRVLHSLLVTHCTYADTHA